MTSGWVTALSAWFANPQLIDIILLMVVTEGVVLGIYHGISGRGLSPRVLWPFLLSGALLLLALRAAILDAAWPWLALPLTGALIAHLFDLSGRWPRQPSGGS